MDITDLFITCNTIVNSEIRGHCNLIMERLDSLIPIADKEEQKERLEELKKQELEAAPAAPEQTT